MNTTNNRNDFYKEQLDKTLNGNEKIETAIAALQKEATEEMLAHTLTVIRHRMQEQAPVSYTHLDVYKRQTIYRPAKSANFLA